MAREPNPILGAVLRTGIPLETVAEKAKIPFPALQQYAQGRHLPKRHLSALEQCAREWIEHCSEGAGRLIVRYPNLRTDEAFRAWLNDLNYAHWTVYGAGLGQEVKP